MKYLKIEELLNEITTGNPTYGPFRNFAGAFEGIFRDANEYEIEALVDLLEGIKEDWKNEQLSKTRQQ